MTLQEPNNVALYGPPGEFMYLNKLTEVISQ